MRRAVLLGIALIVAIGLAAQSAAQKSEVQTRKPAEATKPAQKPAETPKPATAKPAALNPAAAAKPAEAPRPAEATVAAADKSGASPDMLAIGKLIEEFERAFNAHDGKAIAAMFLPDAEIVDAEGTVSIGREEIAGVFTGIFEESPECKMATEVLSLRFVGDSLAFEDGFAVVVDSPEEPAERTRYTVVYVKQEGKWMMASARDLPDELGNSEEQLKQLSWLVGEWIDESPDALVTTNYRWTDNHSFIVGEFNVQVAGRVSMTGSMRIGWDAQAKKLRSWTFDSEGGFNEGLWTRVENEWVVKMTGVTRDGLTATATNVFTYLDKDRATFESYDRYRGDEPAGDVDPIVLVRKPPKPM